MSLSHNSRKKEIKRWKKATPSTIPNETPLSRLAQLRKALLEFYSATGLPEPSKEENSDELWWWRTKTKTTQGRKLEIPKLEEEVQADQ